MFRHIQRKRFADSAFATETAANFRTLAEKMPGIALSVEVRQIGGESWLYLTQTGDVITNATPALAGYERVSDDR